MTDMSNYDKILALPEDTKDQVRDKINCFIAEDYYLRDQMKALDLQRKLLGQHHERLMVKLKGIVLAEPTTTKAI